MHGSQEFKTSGIWSHSVVENDIAIGRTTKGRITKEKAAKKNKRGVKKAGIALTCLFIKRKNLIPSTITDERFSVLQRRSRFGSSRCGSKHLKFLRCLIRDRSEYVQNALQPERHQRLISLHPKNYNKVLIDHDGYYPLHSHTCHLA